MVILINPLNPAGSISNKDMMGGLGQLYPDTPEAARVPPLDLFYCAAILRRTGVDFRLFDFLAENSSVEEVFHAVRALAPSDIFLRTSLPTLQQDMDFAGALKRETGARIWLTGPAAGIFQTEVFSGGDVDFVISKEVEAVISALARSNLDPSGIPGVVSRGAVGAVSVMSTSDLDELPYPLWSEADYKKYRIAAFFGDEAFLPVLASRGCPFGCSYCPYTKLQGVAWRERSVASVIGEIRRNHAEFGISNILFRDPEFTLNEARSFQLCEEMAELGFKLSWVCETRPDTLNDRLMREMAAAGCRQINFGVESMSEKVLSGVHRKHVSREQIVSVVKSAEKYGIKLFCFFIMGLPGQTKKDVLDDIEFAYSNLPGLVQFTYATPYPSTEMFRWAEAHGFVEVRDYAKYTGYNPVMRNEHMDTADLSKLFAYAYDRLRSRAGADNPVTWPGGAAWRALKAYLKSFLFCGRRFYLRYFL